MVADLIEGSGPWTKTWDIPIPRDSESPPLNPWESPREAPQSEESVDPEMKPAWL